MATPANDANTSQRIVDELDANFIVEAGAGTGKTYALVSRVAALVKSGVAMPNIVAITFTEAAAAELSERIRSRLEQLLDAGHPDNAGDPLFPLDDSDEKNIQTAIAELDQASIQTIHSFAAQILRERPMDAGLPPGWVTLDEVEASEHFADQWDAWLDKALGRDTDAGQELQSALRYLMGANVGINRWRDIAEAFSGNYDRLGDDSVAAVTGLTSGIAKHLDALRELAGRNKGKPDDLLQLIEDTIQNLESVSNTASDTPSDVVLPPLTRPNISVGRTGRAPNWNGIMDVRARFINVVRDMDNAALAALMGSLRQEFALDYVRRRKAEGVATFDDLLVWARDLLRDNAEARAHFQGRYSRILIDEFQDTDPLQAEIAFYLASQPDAGVGAQPWHRLPLAPGKLFIVGDDKQSIYRFRNADIAVVQQVKDGGQLAALPLSENRRSQKAVLDWVNAVFGGADVDSDGSADGDRDDGAAGLMQGEAGVQAEYVPLQPNAGIQQDGLGSVRVFGGATDDNAEAYRRSQATDVANLIAAYAGENAPHRFDVYDRETGELRPANLRDVCILIRSRTGLGILLRALDNVGSGSIPYRLAGGSLYFDTQEVQDLLNCLRAIDDPSDEVSVVAALCSPALACSDTDLLRWRDACGQYALWNYQSRRLDTDGDERDSLLAVAPVWEGMQTLRQYHERSRADSVAQLIADFVRDRRLDELDLAENRPREIWRRRQFLIEQARAQECDRATGGGAPLTLRQFLRWAETMQDDNRRRISDSAAPERDDDAVQIMTMHAAKGLEFPIVILLGLDYDPASWGGRGRPAVLTGAEGQPAEVKVGSGSNEMMTPGYALLLADEEKHSESEAIRLAYVAATRARDHLLVSLYRTERASKQLLHRIANLPNLPQREVGDDIGAVLRQSTPESAPATTGDCDLDGWQKDRAAAIAVRSRRQAATATWLAERVRRTKADAADEGVALDNKEAERRERYSRGRGGTSLGSAVHGALQDLVTELQSDGKLPLPRNVNMTREVERIDDDIRRLAKRHAAENGLTGRESVIRQLVEQALQHDAVGKALKATGGLWPEISVAAPLGDGPSPVVMEGIIDLLYQDDDGRMVILDYKTDLVENEGVLDAKMRYYQYQGAAYADAVQKATGQTVKAVQFLFIRYDDADNRLKEVGNWEKLAAELPGIVAAGAA